MGLGHSPRIVTSGLVFAIDAANIKSINLPTQADHGWADWYCLTSGTATYSIVDAGVSIFERTPAGVVTTVVGPSTGPTRGTISVTVGNTYYGDGPINLVVEDGHQCLVPTTMAGTLFWSNAARTGSQPYTIFVYSPHGPAQLRYYDATTQGIYSAPTAVLNVAQGSITTLQTNNNGGTNSHMWLTSNVPVLATANATSADKTILSPMSQYVYRRYPGWNANQANTTGTLVSYYYTLSDSNTANKVMDMNVADGSGGDSAQGLGLEYLSENYSWGNYLSDYVIAAPYSSTNVSVQHWNGSVWTTLENHTLSGLINNANGLVRDGTANVGNNGTNIAGTASYFNNSQLWRWIGNKPFYLAINDTFDDEFAVLGWSTASVAKKPRTSNTINDLSGNFRNLTIYGSPTHNPEGYFTLANNQTNQYMVRYPFETPTGDITYNCWFRSNFTSTLQTVFTYSVGGNNEMLFYINNSTNLAPHPKGMPQAISTFSMANVWVNFSWTRELATGKNVFYRDGQYVGEYTANAGVTIASGGYLIIGQEADAPGGGFDANQNLDGDFARLDIYNRVLTPEEVQQNFNALRGRFGL